MKKKLLFCIHNHFYLKHYILDLKKLEKDFEISILTSNYLIKNPKLEKDSIFREIKIKDIFLKLDIIISLGVTLLIPIHLLGF